MLKLTFENFSGSRYDNEEQLFRAKLSALVNMREPALLILDSIDAQPNDITILDEFLKNSGLHIIITTRTQGVFENLPSINIAPMEGKMQSELVNLENDSYVIFEQLNGKNITRLHPMIRNIVRYAFFGSEAECGDFIVGICRVMREPSAMKRVRDLYSIVMNILNFLKLNEFTHERVDEWLEEFRNFFTN